MIRLSYIATSLCKTIHYKNVHQLKRNVLTESDPKVGIVVHLDLLVHPVDLVLGLLQDVDHLGLHVVGPLVPRLRIRTGGPRPLPLQVEQADLDLGFDLEPERTARTLTG